MKLAPLTLTALLLISACSTSSEEPTATPTPATTSATTTPSPTPTTPATSTAPAWPRGIDKNLLDVDETDPDAVGLAWVTIATAYDTATDTNPADAMRRAAPLLSPALAEYFTDETAVRTDKTWNDAATHDAYTKATVQRVDLNPPTDTETTKHRDYEIMRTWTGNDGYERALDPLYISIRLSQTPSGKWQISDIA